MNLHGSITELQNRVVGLYLKLQQRFKENNVISELWSAMASDLSQQVNSLDGLPGNLWHELKRDDQFSGVIGDIRSRIPEDTEHCSLLGCFEYVLSIEEPVILKIYGPILRNLREHWSTEALDFYILVKAHLARITRVMQAYSGDPLILQRSSSLLQQFEKEVQAPPATVLDEMAVRKRPAREKKSNLKSKRSSAPTHPLAAKHAKTRNERGKSLVEKIDLRRRRARR